jgi:N-acetylmuramoyl-L-alanine amidase
MNCVLFAVFVNLVKTVTPYRIMHIDHHILYTAPGEPCIFRESPNHGGLLEPRLVIMHYTAMKGVEAAVERLTDPKSEVSCHLLIGRGGELIQLLPFNTIAWHAGISTWKGLTSLNSYSIGIELDNAGWLTQNKHRFLSWQELEYPLEEVYHHQTYVPGQPAYWHAYTDIQISRALAVTRVLINQYAIEAILGHEEVAPVRKTDPGPAFPMATFRQLLA